MSPEQGVLFITSRRFHLYNNKRSDYSLEICICWPGRTCIQSVPIRHAHLTLNIILWHSSASSAAAIQLNRIKWRPRLIPIRKQLLASSDDGRMSGLPPSSSSCNNLISLCTPYHPLAMTALHSVTTTMVDKDERPPCVAGLVTGGGTIISNDFYISQQCT